MKTSVLTCAVGIFAVACGSSSTAVLPDAGPAADGSPSGLLGFAASNVKLDGIDVSKVEAQSFTGNCYIDGETSLSDCFTTNGFASAVVSQADGSKVGVFIVKSLRVEATAHVTVGGNIPLVLVSLGDMTILGSIAAHGLYDVATAGGFSQPMQQSKGGGPGGGPKGTGAGGAVGGVAGGGASFCGLGGKGGAEFMTMDVPGAPAAAYGAVDLRPLIGGSSGGSGDGVAGGGGGALQLVAGGAFAMNAGSSINVGGGGAGPGGTTGQNPGGAGSGGSVLIEALTVSLQGVIASNGGGGGAGGSSAGGKDGSPDLTPAPGGVGTNPGGAGSAGTSVNGVDGKSGEMANPAAGGGGGGTGRIRINSLSGVATITGTFSPAASTPCMTQGKVRAPGTGI